MQTSRKRKLEDEPLFQRVDASLSGSDWVEHVDMMNGETVWIHTAYQYYYYPYRASSSGKKHVYDKKGRRITNAMTIEEAQVRSSREVVAKNYKKPSSKIRVGTNGNKMNVYNKDTTKRAVVSVPTPSPGRLVPMHERFFVSRPTGPTGGLSGLMAESRGPTWGATWPCGGMMMLEIRWARVGPSTGMMGR